MHSFDQQFDNHRTFLAAIMPFPHSSIILIMAVYKDRKVYFPLALEKQRGGGGRFQLDKAVKQKARSTPFPCPPPTM